MLDLQIIWQQVWGFRCGVVEAFVLLGYYAALVSDVSGHPISLSSRVKQFKVLLGLLDPKTGQIGFPETSVTNCQPVPRNIPEDQRPQFGSIWEISCRWDTLIVYVRNNVWTIIDIVASCSVQSVDVKPAAHQVMLRSPRPRFVNYVYTVKFTQ